MWPRQRSWKDLGMFWDGSWKNLVFILSKSLLRHFKQIQLFSHIFVGNSEPHGTFSSFSLSFFRLTNNKLSLPSQQKPNFNSHFSLLGPSNRRHSQFNNLQTSISGAWANKKVSILKKILVLCLVLDQRLRFYYNSATCNTFVSFGLIWKEKKKLFAEMAFLWFLFAHFVFGCSCAYYCRVGILKFLNGTTLQVSF